MTSPCTEQPRMARMEEKIDQLIEIQIDNAVLHEIYRNLKEESDEVKRRVAALEKYVWPAVGALSVVSPILTVIITQWIRS